MGVLEPPKPGNWELPNGGRWGNPSVWSATHSNSSYRRNVRSYNQSTAVDCCDKQESQHCCTSLLTISDSKWSLGCSWRRTDPPLPWCLNHHPGKAPALSPGSNRFSCLDESHLKWVLAIMEETDFSLSVHIFPLPKSNASAEEHRFSRGMKFLHSLFSSHTPCFTLSLNAAAARSSFRGPAKPSLQESPAFGLVLYPNGQKMLDLPGKAHWLGTAFPSGGQWLWNLLSELSLFAGSLFNSAACFRATEWFGIEHSLKEQQTEVWGLLYQQLSACSLQTLQGRLCFFGVKWHPSKSTPAKVRWPGMPGLSLKCLFLIKGSGVICLDRPDCTTA